MSESTQPTSEKWCNTCRFYFPEISREDQWGECHRHAPAPFLSQDKDVEIRITNWPEVYHYDLCGEWQEYIEAE